MVTNLVNPEYDACFCYMSCLFVHWILQKDQPFIKILFNPSRSVKSLPFSKFCLMYGFCKIYVVPHDISIFNLSVTYVYDMIGYTENVLSAFFGNSFSCLKLDP